MTEIKQASIVISSYNYGSFLANCIDSALEQTYPHTEVIVVDDGSTDDSRDIIARYGNRVTPLLKENGGQASALNAGFRASQGEVVIFLDSDDMLLPTTVEKVIPLFKDGRAAKAHWPLWSVDPRGKKTGKMMYPELPEGDLREAVVARGPHGYGWPPTSGNAWSRIFLEQVFPIPEAEYTVSPDLYLAALAPLFGHVKRLAAPQGLCRWHAQNCSKRETFEARLKNQVDRANHCFGVLASFCRKMDIAVDPHAWIADSWWHQIDRTVKDLLDQVPPGSTFILATQDEWSNGEMIAGRRRISFPQREVNSDEAAIQEFERLREPRADFMVFAWPQLWWPEYFPGLLRHLRAAYGGPFENDRLVIFSLGNNTCTVNRGCGHHARER
jgi:glycosyltransferase involved in cell wall biosynthesis